MALSDTSEEAARMHVALLRNATRTERFERARNLSNTVISLSRRAIQRRHPDWSEQRVALEWVRLNYGPELANDVGRRLKGKRDD